MKKEIRVAIVGVGNCASSLVQGVSYYSKGNIKEGLMHEIVGGYHISDIKFVAAFDVDKRKVGQDLSKAIFLGSNCTKKFSDVSKIGIIVKKGLVLDGIAEHMKDSFISDDKQKSVDIVKSLKEANADILICYLPVGSKEASRYYAKAALDTGVSFINAIPEFICSDKKWGNMFKKAGIPCAGDDIKSQIGATILHRVITRLIEDRGHTIENTYQLNIAGNTDFLNMKDENRIQSKRISKTNAVLSILDNKDIGIRIGPSDYIPHLKDNKVCYINIKGKQFGNIPFELDLKLSVEDSPNSAGVMTEVIRAIKVARDKKLSGPIIPICAYAFKTPPVQMRDNIARDKFDGFIN
jgi:myo-inositol-1-phosphate synthase